MIPAVSEAIADEPTSHLWEQIVTDDFGVDLTQSALDDTEAVRATFLEALRSKNRSCWVLGDLWIERSDFLLDLIDPSIMSLKTIENYGSTCRTFPKVWRKIPLSISHYSACAKLARVRPTEALDLLREAFTHKLGREAVHDEAARLLGETDSAIEVMLTWSGEQQVWIPDRYLELPAGTTRTIRLKISG